MADEVRNFRQAGWQIDLGVGNRVEAEVHRPGHFWLALGPGIIEIDSWLKAVAGFDLRVRVERLADGVAVILDRGEIQPPWWTESGAPRLIVKMDQQARRVTVTAVTGEGDDAEEFMLSQIIV